MKRHFLDLGSDLEKEELEKQQYNGSLWTCKHLKESCGYFISPPRPNLAKPSQAHILQHLPVLTQTANPWQMCFPIHDKKILC
jgi:hypothetical protein